ncbi:hypothetical protein BGZ81_001009 [Podila clonocystis]|nr:hypothetical protein BGZ81_001009 [Podila clonocystis]
MSRINTHYNTQDECPLLNGRPVDDPGDYNCRTQDYPAPASRLVFVHYILLTNGGLLFGFITTPLAWLGILTKLGYQSHDPYHIVHEMERKNREPQTKGYHERSFSPQARSAQIERPGSGNLYIILRDDMNMPSEMSG